MSTLEEQKEEFLKHYGVPGMKWGKRGAAARSSSPKAPKAPKKPLTKQQKQARNDLIKIGVIGTTYAALRIGGNYLLKHPEVVTRAANKINGTKAIGVGYDVITLSFKNGRWS